MPLNSNSSHQKQAAAAALRTARASGGSVKVHSGPIHSAVAGRTDHLPMNVASGSYVIPADIISAMGEGNSMAGFKIAKDIFSAPDMTSGTPYGEEGLPYGATSPRKAGGGAADSGMAATRIRTVGGGGGADSGMAASPPRTGGGAGDSGQVAARRYIAPVSRASQPPPARPQPRGSQPPPARPQAAPVQADRYTGLWDMINGGGKGAGYKNLGDMFDGGGMGASGERPAFGDFLMGKTNGYNSWLDRVNGGGKGASFFTPAQGGVAAPAPATAAPDGTWLNRNAGLVGAIGGTLLGAGPIAGTMVGNAFKKDDQGQSKVGNFFGMAAGGKTDGVPIVAAGGEYVIPPEDVVHIGGGDLDHGHKILDAFVKKMRQKTIKTLQGLPGPKKD